MVIYRHKDKYSICEMCRFFEVSRSGYYGYIYRMEVPAWDLPLVEIIRECQEKCGKTYGYRRVQIWLQRHGIYRNPKTVLRVMQKYGLLSGKACSLDVGVQKVIGRQGNVYTRLLLSAVMLGGGAAVSRRVSEGKGVSRAFTLEDDKVNAEGFERILEQMPRDVKKE